MQISKFQKVAGIGIALIGCISLSNILPTPIAETLCVMGMIVLTYSFSFLFAQTIKPYSKSKTASTAPIAIGGKGGDGAIGGAGGNAHADGNRAYAEGGKGGEGINGGRGGDGGGGSVVGPGGFAMGGEGGSAGANGVGGKGGRSPLEILGIPNIVLPNGTNIWDYGRGGDGASAPAPEEKEEK